MHAGQKHGHTGFMLAAHRDCLPRSLVRWRRMTNLPELARASDTDKLPGIQPHQTLTYVRALTHTHTHLHPESATTQGNTKLPGIYPTWTAAPSPSALGAQFRCAVHVLLTSPGSSSLHKGPSQGRTAREVLLLSLRDLARHLQRVMFFSDRVLCLQRHRTFMNRNRNASACQALH